MKDARSNYVPPWWLRNGLIQTLYIALGVSHSWQKHARFPEPPYREHVFQGAGGVPIYGWVALPPNAHSTIVGTYGITGSLENQWYLRLLGQKAFAQGFAVVLFDWRGHGKTAELSPTLTSDGLFEGEDFIRIGQQAKSLGCPAPFWLTGYSLGGQLALWGVKAGQDLGWSELGGGAVICPSLDSLRSLTYLVNHPLGRYLERAIAKELQRLAWRLHEVHPGSFDPLAIDRADSIWGFDQELVIGRLGFASVPDYYRASSPLPWLGELGYPVLILYAADDPLFDPTLVAELQTICDGNPWVKLRLTRYGGHVGYWSSQHWRTSGEPDPWWAWNRVLDWCLSQSRSHP